MEAFYYICDFLNTAAQIWFVLQLTDGMFEAKVTGKRLLAGQAVIIGAVALFKCWNDFYTQTLFSNLFLILIALLIAVGGKMLYECSILKAFYLNTLGFVLLALIDFFIQTCVYLVLEERGMSKDILLSISIWRGSYLVISAILLEPMGINIRCWLKKWRNEVTRYWKQGIILIFPMLVCMVYFQQIYIYKVSEYLLGRWGMFVLGNVLLCVLFWIYSIKHRTDEAVRMQQMKVEMLESNYLSLQQIYNEKAVLIHDMKNHMFTVRQILERGKLDEALGYVAQIAGELQESGNRIWTRHEMLDLILNRKIQEAQKSGITVCCECDDMSGLKLTTMDICALFANLLDNAIEANERCPEGADRRLDVKCRKRERMMVVTIQNRIAEKEAAKGVQILQTTKKDKKEHGYGMKSIRKVVDSYGGEVEANIKNNVFWIQVSLVGFED